MGLMNRVELAEKYNVSLATIHCWASPNHSSHLENWPEYEFKMGNVEYYDEEKVAAALEIRHYTMYRKRTTERS